MQEKITLYLTLEIYSLGFYVVPVENVIFNEIFIVLKLQKKIFTKL
jgi:hypothetical protein